MSSLPHFRWYCRCYDTRPKIIVNVFFFEFDVPRLFVVRIIWEIRSFGHWSGSRVVKIMLVIKINFCCCLLQRLSWQLEKFYSYGGNPVLLPVNSKYADDFARMGNNQNCTQIENWSLPIYLIQSAVQPGSINEFLKYL